MLIQKDIKYLQKLWVQGVPDIGITNILHILQKIENIYMYVLKIKQKQLKVKNIINIDTRKGTFRGPNISIVLSFSYFHFRIIYYTLVSKSLLVFTV